MSSIQQTFLAWARDLNEEEAHEVTKHQVNSRVSNHILVGLDGVATHLGVSRGAVAAEIIEAGIFDALDALGLVLTTDDAGTWVVVRKDTPA